VLPGYTVIDDFFPTRRRVVDIPKTHITIESAPRRVDDT
jgi:hypothetical protein